MTGFFLLPINTPTDTPEPSIQSQNLLKTILNIYINKK